MKPFQMLLFALLVLLLGAMIVVTGISFPNQAVALAAVTQTPLTTLTPPMPIFVPTLQTALKAPTKQPIIRRTPEPTATISGPLLDKSFETQKKLYVALPTAIGKFRILTFLPNERGVSANTSFSLESDTKARYSVDIMFYTSAGSAYRLYKGMVSQMTGGRSVDVGDAAYIALQDPYIIGVMQYRNAVLRIYSNIAFEHIETNPKQEILTEQQLMDVFQMVLAGLK